MSVSSLMQAGASGWASRNLIVRPIAKFTTPLENTTFSQVNLDTGTNYSGFAARSYDSSDYSWTQSSCPVQSSGWTGYIDWDVPNQNYDILFVVAVSGMGTVFNNRGQAYIGVANNDGSKYFKLGRSGYNSNNTNYWIGYLSRNTRTETSGEYTVEAETSSAISSWYMGFRYSMQNGAFKGYKSYDSGSTWSLVVSGTHAAYAEMTKVVIAVSRRLETGSKITLLDADPYKYDIVL
jgi:hypothetical protein